MPRPGALLPVLLSALLLGVCGPAWADAPAKPPTAAEAALARLRSPVQDERREAVAALVDLLPGVRAQVIEALPKASWTMQIHLLEVLARDQSPEAVGALLRHLVRTDETQAVLIRMYLVRDRVASTQLLATFRKDRRGFLKMAGKQARGLQRLFDLVQLLQRAEIEDNFVSRKSKSGSTGYYRGQYDILKPEDRGSGYRAQALEVVVGIALDEAVPTPGVYTSGVYRFLRPHAIDEVELNGMAVNAVSELCTAEDKRIILRLATHLMKIDQKRRRHYRGLLDLLNEVSYDSKEYQDALVDWEDVLGEYGDLVACLAIIVPDIYLNEVMRFIRELRSYDYPRMPRYRLGYIAALLIRVGRYPEAIAAYEEYLRYGSRTLSYYNLACAYSSWSQEEGASAGARADRRQLALIMLEQAVDAGWSDVGWMNEDRDLDAIRDAPVYRELVKRIEKSFELDDEEDK